MIYLFQTFKSIEYLRYVLDNDTILLLTYVFID